MSFSQRVLLVCAFLLLAGCQSWQYRNLESLPPTAALPQSSQPGVVHAFYWDNVSGREVENLTTLATYPDEPDEVLELNALSGPTNRGDNYGTLVRGFIEAPADGEYQFFVSGDDETQFLLSPSEKQSEATIISAVPSWGWTNLDEFDKYSSQTSPIQVLRAGQKYYFEIRHKEAAGGDRYSVAWTGPGIERTVISGPYLHSLATGPDLTPDQAYSLGYRVGFLDGTESLAFNPTFPPLDQDGDGLYDNWEVVHGLNPDDPADASTDPDNDLLSAEDEFLLGTDENNADTDGDGIPDGAEFAFGLDPLDPSDSSEDLDNDGFTNLQEYTANTAIDDPNDKPEVSPQYVTGFAGQYFEGTAFDRFITLRVDEAINFTWAREAPMPEVPADGFSVRWTGWFKAPHSNGSREYRFTATTDDGVRLYLNNERVIDDWTNHGPTSFLATAVADPGEEIPITVEYYEDTRGAVAVLEVRDTANNTVVPISETIRTLDPTTEHSTDSDSDGIPDTWELKFGLNQFADDASEVLNASGVSNLEAYSNSLNPWTLEPVTQTDSGATAPETGVNNGTPVTLTWTAPSTRMDGTSISLSEIDYYVISYGQSEGSLSETQQVDGAETSFQFENLAPGTWYFTIRVVDMDGLSSPESEPVSVLAD